MTGHVQRKGARWYIVIDFGAQPSRRCPTPKCGHIEWTSVPDELRCEKCNAALEPPTKRRRRQWQGSWAKKADAKNALTEQLGHLQKGTYVAPKNQTLTSFIEDDWLPALQVRPSTAASYSRNLRLHVLPKIGSVQLQAIDPAHLNRLYRDLAANGHKGHRKGEGLSPRTTRYIHTIIHRVLKDAVKWNRLVRNPADAADPPRAKDAIEAAPEMQTWSGQQLGEFLRWVAATRYGPAFTFAATTAMRRGEVLGLRWSDVDLDSTPAVVTVQRALIMVNHQVRDGQTKTGRARVIELDATTVGVLRQQRTRQGQDKWMMKSGYGEADLVFCHPDGRAYNPERFSREFDRKQDAYNKANPDAPLPRLRFHDLRHTWATLALQGGEHPKVVAERLGHSNTNITLSVYSHVVEGMQSQAAENVAAMIFGGPA